MAKLAERLGGHAGRSPSGVGGVREFGHAYDAGDALESCRRAGRAASTCNQAGDDRRRGAFASQMSSCKGRIPAVLALVGSILLGFVCAIERWVGLEG